MLLCFWKNRCFNFRLGLLVCMNVLLIRKVQILLIFISFMLVWLRILFLVIIRWLWGIFGNRLRVVFRFILKVCRLWLLMFINGVFRVFSVCFSLVLLCILISMLRLIDLVVVVSLVISMLFSVEMISRMQLVLIVCVLMIWYGLIMKFLWIIGSVQVVCVFFRQVLVFWKKFMLVSIDRYVVLFVLQLWVIFVGMKCLCSMFLFGDVFLILVIIVGFLCLVCFSRVLVKLCGVLVLCVSCLILVRLMCVWCLVIFLVLWVRIFCRIVGIFIVCFFFCKWW